MCVLASGKWMHLDCEMFVNRRLLDYSIHLPQRRDQILQILSSADLCKLFIFDTVAANLQFIFWLWWKSCCSAAVKKRGGALYNPFSSLGGAPVCYSFCSWALWESHRCTHVPLRHQAAPCHHELFSFIVELKPLSGLDSSSLYTLFQHSYRQYELSEDVKGFLKCVLFSQPFLQALQSSVYPHQSAKNPSSSEHC